MSGRLTAEREAVAEDAFRRARVHADALTASNAGVWGARLLAELSALRADLAAAEKASALYAAQAERAVAESGTLRRVALAARDVYEEGERSVWDDDGIPFDLALDPLGGKLNALRRALDVVAPSAGVAADTQDNG